MTPNKATPQPKGGRIESEWLDTKEVAVKLNVTVGCLVRWRRQNKPPAFTKLNGIIRYRRADVEAALAMGSGCEE